MNLAFFSRFSKNQKSNTVLKIIRHIKKHPVFKRARLDFYTPTLHPEKLVILLGQMHTVWKGKIGNRERKKIVHCQARLCSYYAYLEQFHNVRRFGGEGLYEGLNTSFHDQLAFQLYKEIEKKLAIQHPVRLEQLASVAKRILHELGKEWQNELRLQKDLKKIQRYASAVSGQTLFNYLTEPSIDVYPIEGEKAYQQVLEGISHLGDRIAKLDKSYEMTVIRQRGGKATNEKEAELVKQYNVLTREFNKTIGSDIRERATVEILKEKSKTDPIVVFTMGVGHRKNYLKLIDEYLKDTKTAFVFITAPELLINLWVAIGIPLLVLIALLALGFWL